MSYSEYTSAYDLLATYSTAATYTASTGSSDTGEVDSTFADLLEAESSGEASYSEFVDNTNELLDDALAMISDDDDDTTDTTIGDVLDEMQEILDEIDNTVSGNSIYYRPDGSDPLEPDDGPSDELSFMDMLQLMILQFQNQTIDDTASTTDMMNQLCQMTTMQAMTSMEDSITAMTKTNEMLYISSLVGEEVTVGYTDGDGAWTEYTGTVTGAGYYGGYPVVFLDDMDTFFYTSEILAVGRLPETSTETDPEEDDGDVDGVDPEGETGDGTDDDGTVDGTEGTEGTEGSEGSDSTGDGNDAAEIDLSTYGYNFVDYSNLTEEELLEVSQTAFG